MGAAPRKPPRTRAHCTFPTYCNARKKCTSEPPSVENSGWGPPAGFPKATHDTRHAPRPCPKVTARMVVLCITKYLTRISQRVSSVPEGAHGSGYLIANQAFPLFSRRRRPLLGTRPSLLQPCPHRRYRLLVHCYLAALPPRPHADFLVPLHHP